MIICKECGFENEDNVKFCAECGFKLITNTTENKSTDIYKNKFQQIISDKYHLEKEIGHGGMSIVYKAKDVIIERDVAIKLILPYSTDQEKIFERFKREAKLSGKFSHPNILSVYYIEMINEYAYMVMEYLSYGSLRDYIKNGKMEEKNIISIVLQIADALKILHNNDIIHRDIKPDNILFRTPDIPVLTDFGIAKSIDSVKLTQTGMSIGSPYYMSPEQIKGLELDARSDLYSLGCMMYEMATGVIPFPGEDTMAVLYKHVNEKADLQKLDDAKVSTNLKNVISKLLENDKEKRIQKAEELINYLGGQKEVYNIENEKTVLIKSIDKKDETKTSSKKGILSKKRNLIFIGITIVISIISFILLTKFFFNTENEKTTVSIMYVKSDGFNKKENRYFYVFVRKKPFISKNNEDVIGRLEHKSQVEILDEKDGWFYVSGTSIKIEGGKKVKGWVSKKYLSKEKP